MNLWQAQNLWYEILRNNSHALTMLEDDELPRWKKDFSVRAASTGTSSISRPFAQKTNLPPPPQINFLFPELLARRAMELGDDLPFVFQFNRSKHALGQGNARNA